MASASASAEDSRKIRVKRKPRWCLICNRDLFTCKRYSTLATKVRKNPSFLALLSDIVEDSVVPSSTTFICDGCDTKVEKIHKSVQLRTDLKESYHQTKARRSISSDDAENYGRTTPTQRHSPQKRSQVTPRSALLQDRQKRKAVSSPGTPSTRKVSNCKPQNAHPHIYSLYLFCCFFTPSHACMSHGWLQCLKNVSTEKLMTLTMFDPAV